MKNYNVGETVLLSGGEMATVVTGGFLYTARVQLNDGTEPFVLRESHLATAIQETRYRLHQHRMGLIAADIEDGRRRFGV